MNYSSWMKPGLVLAVLVTSASGLCAGELATEDTTVEVATIEGRLSVTSMRDAAGRNWIGTAIPIPLVDAAELGGRRTAVHWRFAGEMPADARSNTRQFRFASDAPALEMISTWVGSRGPGPIEHRITIQNLGKEAIVLPVQPTLVLGIRSPAGRPLEQWWLDKGGGTPTVDGTHHRRIDPGSEFAVQSWSAGRENPRDDIPWTSVQDVDGRCGWYAGVEHTAAVQIALQVPATVDGAGANIRAVLGLQNGANAEFVTRISGGESIELPPVFIGCYRGDVDDGANHLRRWVREKLTPPTNDPRYPVLVNNSWGSGMAVDDRLARRMIDESAELGLEMFHIDAGWFRGVGDWRPNTKFPRGLGPIADYAHGKGLKFGLWVGWTQGGEHTDPTGAHSILSVRDPTMVDWFPNSYAPNWKPADFTGATVCLGDQRAVDWCLSTLREIIHDARLDMLEHDQVMVIDACSRTGHSHTASPIDAGFRAACGYYKVYDLLRAENPNLMFENCVNGGRMIDYGAVRRCHYISITDTYDPLSNRRAFYDASYALPPAMCECYIENVKVNDIGQFKSMLRSGMMGWCTIMTDTTRWTPAQHDAAKQQFDLYKKRLRPLIRSADLYHVSDRPDGRRWDGIEYYDASSGHGVLFAFRGSTADAAHAFLLKGLDPAAQYTASFEDHSSEPITQTGDELAKLGLKLALPAECSEIVFLQRK